jgi:hypothetical protein
MAGGANGYVHCYNTFVLVCSDCLYDLDREEPRMTIFNLTISDHMIVLGGVIAALVTACFLLWRLPR